MTFGIIQGVLVGVALLVVTLLVKTYRNKIVYEGSSLQTVVYGTEDDLSFTEQPGKWRNHINAYRVAIENVGFLDLKDVELHIETQARPFQIHISDVKSISKGAILFTAEDNRLKLSMPSLPKGERFVVAFSSFGPGEFFAPSLRGTNTGYKVVKRDKHEVVRSGRYWGLMIMFILGVIVHDVFIKR